MSGPQREGVHRAALTQGGLHAVAQDLAAGAPIPVEVSVTPERCSSLCESAAYFVMAEALADVTRHSDARRAAVRVDRADDDLVVEVTDDGVGSAELSRGSGLRGLADRVTAVGGRLELDSPPGAGTRLTARIPCG